MKRILSVFTVFLSFLAVLAVPSVGQEAQDPIRNAYGYDAWPGKTGAVKNAPSLDLLAYPGYVLLDKTAGSGGTTYTLGEGPGKPRVSVTVKAYESASAAQAGLLGVLSQYSMILTTAESKNLNVGDKGFVMQENDMLTFAAFVRNNITVVVNNVAPDKPNVVRDIASQVDLMI